jgi:hypothetical protein
MASLKKLWEQSFASDNDVLAKEAAAHGLTTDKYLEAVAEAKVEQEQQQKVAESNREAYGNLVGLGIKQGIAAELGKLAAFGGDANAARLLRSIFCE